jgi:hypothetical protein
LRGKLLLEEAAREASATNPERDRQASHNRAKG